MTEEKTVFCPYCQIEAELLDSDVGDLMDKNELFHCKKCELDFGIRTGEAVKDWADEVRNKQERGDESGREDKEKS